MRFINILSITKLGLVFFSLLSSPWIQASGTGVDLQRQAEERFIRNYAATLSGTQTVENKLAISAYTHGRIDFTHKLPTVLLPLIIQYLDPSETARLNRVNHECNRHTLIPNFSLLVDLIRDDLPEYTDNSKVQIDETEQQIPAITVHTRLMNFLSHRAPLLTLCRSPNLSTIHYNANLLQAHPDWDYVLIKDFGDSSYYLWRASEDEIYELSYSKNHYLKSISYYGPLDSLKDIEETKWIHGAVIFEQNPRLRMILLNLYSFGKQDSTAILSRATDGKLYKWLYQDGTLVKKLQLIDRITPALNRDTFLADRIGR